LEAQQALTWLLLLSLGEKFLAWIFSLFLAHAVSCVQNKKSGWILAIQPLSLLVQQTLDKWQNPRIVDTDVRDAHHFCDFNRTLASPRVDLSFQAPPQWKWVVSAFGTRHPPLGLALFLCECLLHVWLLSFFWLPGLDTPTTKDKDARCVPLLIADM
jgi:hypothetical protein